MHLCYPCHNIDELPATVSKPSKSILTELTEYSEEKYIKTKCSSREVIPLICVNPCAQHHQHENLLIRGENKNLHLGMLLYTLHFR